MQPLDRDNALISGMLDQKIRGFVSAMHQQAKQSDVAAMHSAAISFKTACGGQFDQLLPLD